MALVAPHFKVPFQLAGSAAAVVEQDSPEEVTQCVEAVLSTPLGSRLEAPEYGVPDQTFTQLAPAPKLDVYLKAIEDAEPRVRALAEAEVEEMIERVTVKTEVSSV